MSSPAKSDAKSFAGRTEEEWIEKPGFGHMGIDAGSTTLWVMRCLLSTMADHDVSEEVCTNSLLGLAEARELGFQTQWAALGGKLEGRTNAFVSELVDSLGRRK
ncbi:hypothetical protein NA78x_002728 [Anatilimnocola sp. NA78]|uniref:hypothetical protein n=1 Tax=Anatilimnocola sp. NA78 TaxID=3415683 RepID=UPI003CE5C0EB